MGRVLHPPPGRVHEKRPGSRRGHVEHSASSEVRRCSKAGCGFTLWPLPKPRTIRFHDLRHTTATLLLKARVPLAVVQRILGHSSSTITAGVYGHLDVDDMRAGLEQLSFQPSEAPVAEVLRWPWAARMVRRWCGVW